MAHPHHHAENSATRYGGKAKDYAAIHDWFDGSKAHYALPQHRALRHHTAGIFDAEARFGPTITNSAERVVPVRWIGEQHVREDCRRIPSLADWYGGIPIKAWMTNGVLLTDRPDPLDDPKLAWQRAVTDGHTILGLADWLSERAARADHAHGAHAKA